MHSAVPWPDPSVDHETPAAPRRSRRTKLPSWCRIVRERPAAFERDAFAERTHIRCPSDVVLRVSPRFAREEVEVFLVLALDAQHKVFALTEATRGLLNSTLVHPREVFRTGIALGAAALIVAQNDPSGDVTPSGDDRTITEQLLAAGRLLDLPVLDHVIIGDGKYTSFAEAGLL